LADFTNHKEFNKYLIGRLCGSS